jgi:hypothetical protein
MFGFGRGPDKNASDIQLAIDAIDIVFTRPVVEKFVIVSGDGGFASLAKKLHEYGKMVVGCAYAKTTNKVFESVCDDFIWIDVPEEESYLNSGGEDRYSNIKSDKCIDSNPTLTEFSNKYSALDIKAKNDVYKRSKEIFSFLLKSSTTRNAAMNSGMNIGVFHQLINYRIKNFSFVKYGFSRSVDFIRFVIKDTDAKLILKEPSDYRIVRKGVDIYGFTDVDVISKEPVIHSTEGYKRLLSRLHPRFPLPNKDVLFELSQNIVQNKQEYVSLSFGDIVDKLSAEYN